MLLVSLAAIVLAQGIAPQTAAPLPAPPAEPATTVSSVNVAKPADPKKARKICVDTAPIGSIISHKVCRTAEEADADSKKARDAAAEIRDRAAFCGGRNC